MRVRGWVQARRAAAFAAFEDLLDITDRRKRVRVNRLRDASDTTLAVWVSLQEWAPAIVERIVPVADPDRIVLFGSRARAQNRRDSDYDILVVTRVKRSERRRVRVACYQAVRDLPFGRDIIVVTPAEYRRAWRLPGMIVEPFGASWRSALRNAAQEGLVLYERPGPPR
jgi:predicted nucleotidyltransferase